MRKADGSLSHGDRAQQISSTPPPTFQAAEKSEPSPPSVLNSILSAVNCGCSSGKSPIVCITNPRRLNAPFLHAHAPKCTYKNNINNIWNLPSSSSTCEQNWDTINQSSKHETHSGDLKFTPVDENYESPRQTQCPDPISASPHGHDITADSIPSVYRGYAAVQEEILRERRAAEEAVEIPIFTDDGGKIGTSKWNPGKSSSSGGSLISEPLWESPKYSSTPDPLAAPDINNNVPPPTLFPAKGPLSKNEFNFENSADHHFTFPMRTKSILKASTQLGGWRGNFQKALRSQPEYLVLPALYSEAPRDIRKKLRVKRRSKPNPVPPADPPAPNFCQYGVQIQPVLCCNLPCAGAQQPKCPSNSESNPPLVPAQVEGRTQVTPIKNPTPDPCCFILCQMPTDSACSPLDNSSAMTIEMTGADPYICPLPPCPHTVDKSTISMTPIKSRSTSTLPSEQQQTQSNFPLQISQNATMTPQSRSAPSNDGGRPMMSRNLKSDTSLDTSVGYQVSGNPVEDSDDILTGASGKSPNISSKTLARSNAGKSNSKSRKNLKGAPFNVPPFSDATTVMDPPSHFQTRSNSTLAFPSSKSSQKSARFHPTVVEHLGGSNVREDQIMLRPSQRSLDRRATGYVPKHPPSPSQIKGKLAQSQASYQDPAGIQNVSSNFSQKSRSPHQTHKPDSSNGGNPNIPSSKMSQKSKSKSKIPVVPTSKYPASRTTGKITNATIPAPMKFSGFTKSKRNATTEMSYEIICTDLSPIPSTTTTACGKTTQTKSTTSVKSIPKLPPKLPPRKFKGPPPPPPPPITAPPRRRCIKRRCKKCRNKPGKETGPQCGPPDSVLDSLCTLGGQLLMLLPQMNPPDCPGLLPQGCVQAATAALTPNCYGRVGSVVNSGPPGPPVAGAGFIPPACQAHVSGGLPSKPFAMMPPGMVYVPGAATAPPDNNNMILEDDKKGLKRRVTGTRK